MDASQAFFEAINRLKPGDVINANGEIAVIVDVLHSPFTDNVCLYVRFARNVGNARSYDVLELSPQRPLGVTTWQPATPAELETKLTARRAWLEKELSALAQTAQNPTSRHS